MVKYLGGSYRDWMRTHDSDLRIAEYTLFCIKRKERQDAEVAAQQRRH